MAFLPEAQHWQEVDETIRQWAARNGASIVEWKQATCQGYRVDVGGLRVVDVHRPEACWSKEPEPAPRVMTTANEEWVP
jgi:hypothetical protein